ncbi:cation-translocating P-type ATPase [bacterium]|nr:cation-translocating P-type ATPase [bacterium]
MHRPVKKFNWVPVFLTLACAAGGVGGLLLQRGGLPGPAWLFFAPAFLAGSWLPLKAAVESLRERRLDINFLMLLAAYGAAALRQPAEGIGLLFLFTLSGALEYYTLERTKRSIAGLMELRPDFATVLREGREQQVPVDSIQPGELLRIAAGERLALDGVIREGHGSLDESTLTGEGLPVSKSAGQEVFAGTINLRGSLLIEVTHRAGDTMLARIVRLVQEAQEQKVATQARFERWQNAYVIAVLALATSVAAWDYLWGQRPLSDALYHGMVFLVAASPCAVIMSVPAAVLSGLTRAARQGVLIKGGVYLERLAQVRSIALDKTGTLTEGAPAVLYLGNPVGTAEEKARLLQLAASVEAVSEHPLAQAVVQAALEQGLELRKVQDFDTHVGEGVHGEVDQRWVGVGNRSLFESHGVDVPDSVFEEVSAIRRRGLTAVVVSSDGGHEVLGIADRIRASAEPAIQQLRRQGIQHVVILTGDHHLVGEAVAASVGADEVRAELLPENKVDEVRRLQQQYGALAFVGDGVNDGPALAAADIGLAMGSRGTDVALETADIVLMRDDLSALPFAVWLARQTQAAITRGLVLAFGVIILLLAGAATGWLPLWLAVILHEGSTVLTILSGMLLLVQPYRGGAQAAA